VLTPADIIASIPSPSSNALEVGPLTFRYYGLMIALGVLAAVEIASRRWEARGGERDDIIDLAKWAVPAGLIGARLYHVITDWKRFQGRWFDAFKIWEGGLGIPGGLLLGVGVGVWYAKRRGWNITELADAVIPGIPVAQAIGRLGNWFNQEIFGKPSDLPWAVEIDERFRPSEYADSPTFHPTFLYEGLLNLTIAWFLIFADKKKWLKPGQILPLWIMLYGVARFIVEGMRIDEASLIAGVRVNHWVSGAAIVIGAVWFVIIGRRADRRATAEVDGGSTVDDGEVDSHTDVDSHTEVEADEMVVTESENPD